MVDEEEEEEEAGQQEQEQEQAPEREREREQEQEQEREQEREQAQAQAEAEAEAEEEEQGKEEKDEEEEEEKEEEEQEQEQETQGEEEEEGASPDLLVQREVVDRRAHRLPALRGHAHDLPHGKQLGPPRNPRRKKRTQCPPNRGQGRLSAARGARLEAGHVELLRELVDGDVARRDDEHLALVLLAEVVDHGGARHLAAGGP
jgi:hypothetical protein